VTARAVTPRPSVRTALWRMNDVVCTASPQDAPFEEAHGFHTIAAVTAGQFNYRGSTGRASLYPGSFLLGNAGRCYECSHTHGVGDRCTSVHLSPELFDEVATSHSTAFASKTTGRLDFSQAMLPSSTALLPWGVWLANRAWQADPLEQDTGVMALLAATLAVTTQTQPKAARFSASHQRRLNSVVEQLSEHPHHNHDLSSLAQMAHMSPYHFLRVFRLHTGQTPHQFVLHARLRRAALELVRGTAGISNIAYNAGFGDLSSFNARFKTTFDCSPRQYRLKR
jgi:AraC family transcriptional regulator